MKKKRVIRRVVDILMGILILGLYFQPWINTVNGNYNSFQYLKKIYEEKNVVSVIAEDIPELMEIEFRTEGFETLSNEFWCYIFAIVVLIITVAVVFNILNMIFALFGHPKRGMVATAFWVVAIGVQIWYMFIRMISMKMFAYPAIMLIVEGICFFVMSLADEWDELRSYNKEERRKRIERKRRLRFRGVYSALYYKIMWRNLAHQWKDWIMFGISCMFVTLALYTCIGIGSVLGSGHTTDVLASQDILHMVSLVTNDFVVVIFIVTVFIMTLSFTFYLKKRLSGFQVLLTLGIREKSLRFLWKVEIITCFVISSAVGLIAGDIFFERIVAELQTKIPIAKQPDYMSTIVYSLTLICLLIITWFAYNITRDHLNLDIASDVKIVSKKEQYVEQHGSVGKLIWGCILVGAAIYCFLNRRTGENIWILALMFLGVHHIIVNGWSIWLKIKKKIPYLYIKSLTKDHMVTDNFVTSAKYATVLTIIHICVFSLFMIRVVTNEMELEWDQSYPYDYICLASGSDDAIFEKLEKKCDAEVVSIPIIRVTSPDNDESLLKDYPMSFNIGISQKSYKKLKKMIGEEAEKFELDKEGNNVYIVYQQDVDEKSKPLDWWLFSRRPIIYEGLQANIGKYGRGAGFGFDDENTRTVVGSEVSSLTGVFGNGDNENLVVFSNKYFKTARKALLNSELGTEIKGPSELKLVNVSKKYRKEAIKILNEFEEKHREDEAESPYIQSYYSKVASISVRTMKRAMEYSVNMMILLILGVAGIFVMNIKVNAEIPEMQERYKYMACFGMRQKERIYLVCKEIFRFFAIPMSISIIAGAALTSIILNLREFAEADYSSYIHGAGKIGFIYILVQLINIICLQIHAVRKVESEIAK